VSRPIDAPLAQVQVGDVARALSLAGAAWRAAFRAPVLGVAGSNGKTTTKEMLSAILAQRGECLSTRGNLNNHLGVPLRCCASMIGTRARSSRWGPTTPARLPGWCSWRAGRGPDHQRRREHLEGFETLEGVARAEGEMVAGLDPSGSRSSTPTIRTHRCGAHRHARAW